MHRSGYGSASVPLRVLWRSGGSGDFTDIYLCCASGFAAGFEVSVAGRRVVVGVDWEM